MIDNFIDQLIPLDSVPNQSFTITLDNNFYQIVIKETNGVMSSSINRNNIQIQSGARITPGYLMIPYQYQENGNFIFVTENEDYPDYTLFGINQYMLYMTQAELDFLHARDFNDPNLFKVKNFFL